MAIPCAAQTMRDSSYQTQVPARQCVITINYGGTVVRDTLTPDEAAAWINVHGKSSNDTTRPLQEGLKSQLRTEIERCKAVWFAQRDLELGLVDQNDTLTLAEYRAARTAIRIRYRSWLQDRSVKVPVLGGNP
jgi:hypothetical protein